MEGAILTWGLQQVTHPLSFSGIFTSIPCLAQVSPQLVSGRSTPRNMQRLMWVHGQAGSCRGSGGPWLHCLRRCPHAGPQAHGPALRSVEGREFSAKSREQNSSRPQSKYDPGGVRDEGNSLLGKTNLNQGNNELGPKGKRLASKH